MHGLLYLPVVSPHVTPDSASYLVPAKAILHGSYSTPLPAVDVSGLQIPKSAQGAPEHQAYRSPGYPLLLAAVGGGSSGASRAVLYIVQALLFGGTVWLLGLAFARTFGERVGLAAAVLYAADPFSKRYVTLVLSEVEAGFLAIAAVYAVIRAWQSRSLRWWGAAGALIALLTLTRPLFLLALPLAAIAATCAEQTWRRRAIAAAVTVAAGAALLAPWLAWTDTVIGSPAPSAFGAGWNLLLAADGEGLHHTASQVGSSPAFLRDFTSVYGLAPTASELESDPNAHARYLYRADKEQRRLAEHVYWRRLRHNPAQVAWEVVYRAYFLWQAHEDWFQPRGIKLVPLRIFDWLALLLGAYGAVLAWRRSPIGRALAVFLVVFTLANAINHVEARYAFPVRGLLAGFVALTLLNVFPRVRPTSQERLVEGS